MNFMNALEVVAGLPVVKRKILIQEYCKNRVFTALDALKMDFMMPLSFSSTSSLLQDRRALFWAISRPEVERRKKNHYTLSSRLRADQMPGPSQEGQLMCTLFLSMRQ